jgi:hypothetical protein
MQPNRTMNSTVDFMRASQKKGRSMMARLSGHGNAWRPGVTVMDIESPAGVG